MHTIRTDFWFNLLCSVSKLKRGVIEGTGGLFWFSISVNFSSPILFVVFFLLWIMSVNRFQSNLFYILHDIRLLSTFLWIFFMPPWRRVGGHINLPFSVRSSVCLSGYKYKCTWFVWLSPPTVLELQL